MGGISGLYDFLRQDGSIVVNKRLARAIGLKEAVIYSELLSRYYYFEKKGQLDPEGYFFNTIDDLQEGTTISRRYQDSCIKKLARLGLIKTKLAGVPAKRYFKIVSNPGRLLQIMQKEEKDEKVMEVIKAFQKIGKPADVSPEVYEEIKALLEKDTAENNPFKQKFSLALMDISGEE